MTKLQARQPFLVHLHKWLQAACSCSKIQIHGVLTTAFLTILPSLTTLLGYYTIYVQMLMWGNYLVGSVVWFYGWKFIDPFWKWFHNKSKLILGCFCTSCSLSPHPPHVIPLCPFYRAGNWAAGMTFYFFFCEFGFELGQLLLLTRFLSVHAAVHSLSKGEGGEQDGVTGSMQR